MCTGGRLGWRGLVGLAWIGAIAALPAAAQDAKTLRSLKVLHDRVCKPNKALAADDGMQALKQLGEWKLDVEKLEAEPKAQAARVTVYANLATGMCAAAAEQLGALSTDEEDAEVAYLVAAAQGDAETAAQAWEKIPEKARKRWSSGQRGREALAPIGKAAPDRSLETDRGAVPLANRGGKALALLFWEATPQFTDSRIRDIRRDFADVAKDMGTGQFVGVNMDAEDKAEQAKKFATDKKLDWPQYFAGGDADAATFHETFAIPKKAVVWIAIIDRHGFLRAVGVSDDPAVVYAWRAAVAEALEDVLYIPPKTIDGTSAEPKLEEAAAGKGGETPKATGHSGDLPSNADAAEKLKMARLYLKTGKRTDAKRILQEIVRDYPGTREAMDAQDLLDLTP